MKRLHLNDDQIAELAQMRDAAVAELVRLRFDDPEMDQARIRDQVHFRAKVFLLQELITDDFPSPE